MPMRERIEAVLRESFAPDSLEVIDESEKHRGHAGYREGGSSHFRVRIRASALTPMTRLGRHRAIHAALGPGIMDAIHALALEIEG